MVFVFQLGNFVMYSHRYKIGTGTINMMFFWALGVFKGNRKLGEHQGILKQS